ncbi:hypothetical protein GQ54DRAFT_265549 [Martensiomyces pterosporus]|nr:hypothetical protein GQ54DRAFT_265549 [Martensiomyces pterosporus]
MRRSIFSRIFVLALIALVCLASASLAQDGKPQQKYAASPTPTATQDKNKTSAANSRGKSDTAEATRDTDTATEDRSGGKHDNNSDEESTTEDSTNTATATQSFDESYEETGLAGAISLTTPDLMAIPTPMFAINGDVVIGWKYSNETLRPPKRINICGRFPPGHNRSPSNTVACDWTIATNISGSARNYTWNTVTEGAPGYVFTENTGYMMYIYDADYGMTDYLPGAGRAVPFSFKFAMFTSRYGQTNQGVPAGYNPSAAPAVRAQMWAVLGTVALSVLSVMAC